MYIVAIAWAFVALLMALVEATSNQGTLLGALFTLLLYGALPLAIVLYVLNTPYRRRARRAAEAAADRAAAASAAQAEAQASPGASAAAGDRSGHAPAGDTVAPEREKP